MIEYAIKYGRQNVKVTLEFPKQSDKTAETEFVERLKAIYLGKIKAAFEALPLDAKAGEGCE